MLPQAVVDVLLVGAALSAVVLAASLLAHTARGRDVGRVGLLLVTGGWLALAVVPQSTPLRLTSYSYDRYFLSLLPIAVASSLVALRAVRFSSVAAWTALSAMAVFSVAAVHDHLSLQRATWELAAAARQDGVALSDLDGGAAWDGYHLYESDEDRDVEVDLEELRDLGFDGPLVLSERDGPPWWIGYYAPSVTSQTVVANDRLFGYRVLRRLEYSSWLHREPQHVYLLQAADG